ncbi:MAG: FRG domain-containing protein [Thermoguttaceae bacterium]
MENQIEEYMEDMECSPKTYPFHHNEYKVRSNLEPDKVWDRLINFLARRYIDDKNWVFRGHRRETEELKSTLDRQLNKRINSYIGQQTAEDYLLNQFKRAAHHFLNCSMVPDKDDRLEWLSLMRHYGTPTRLLDFTHSPYIACFFALEESADETNENSRNDTKRAIWAINTEWLIEISFPYINALLNQNNVTKNDLRDADFISDKFDDIFIKNTTPFVLPIEPPRANARLLIQQGLFLCPGAANKGFEENLLFDGDPNRMRDNIHKIIIENHIRDEALTELDRMNINQATLYPDLQGFATSLALKLEWMPLSWFS